MEGDIKVIQDKITKHKDQLYQVKTNEQYKAMLKEIEGEESNIRKIEDRVLEKMMEAEETQKHVQEAAARLEGEKARVAGEIKRLEGEGQRDVTGGNNCKLSARKWPPLSQVQSLRSTNESAAIEAARQSRRFGDGLCTACNVRLRPQAYNEVRSNSAVLTCENCSRILYYTEPSADEQVEGSGTEDAEATA